MVPLGCCVDCCQLCHCECTVRRAPFADPVAHAGCSGARLKSTIQRFSPRCVQSTAHSAQAASTPCFRLSTHMEVNTFWFCWMCSGCCERALMRPGCLRCPTSARDGFQVGSVRVMSVIAVPSHAVLVRCILAPPAMHLHAYTMYIMLLADTNKCAHCELTTRARTHKLSAHTNAVHTRARTHTPHSTQS